MDTVTATSLFAALSTDELVELANSLCDVITSYDTDFEVACETEAIYWEILALLIARRP